jgi:glycosyltransferase involved in cell wall biosynthesis
MGKKYHVTAIVLSNCCDKERTEMTRNCIKSLRDCETKDIGILIVLVETQHVNAITELRSLVDKTVFPRKKFSYNQFLNEGYISCYVPKNPGSYILISNNDVIYNELCIHRMIQCMESCVKDIMSVGPTDVDIHGTSDTDIIGYDIPQTLCGWSYLFRADILNTVKFSELFPKEIEFWFSDNYYAEVLKKNGFMHCRVCDAYAKHLHQKSHDILAKNKELERMTHGQREVFNALVNKLHSKKEDVARKDKILLTIAIASLSKRSESFDRIVKQLSEQISRCSQENIELLAIVDNKMMTVGKKRDRLISMAQGEYICFVDDDDKISDDYVDSIYSAINYGHDEDCVTFKCHVTFPGREDKLCVYSRRYTDRDTNEIYERSPNHICAIRTEIASSIPHEDRSYGEDKIWAAKLLPKLKTEKFIDKVLYFYEADPEKSETQEENEPGFSSLTAKKKSYKRLRNLKIAVYAIALNEEKNVDRFMESIKQAEVVVVCDTGSEDDTIKKINEHQGSEQCIDVHQINVSPFRFDVARNTALSLVPKNIDICIKLDLDETMVDGWRDAIEEAYSEGVNRFQYLFQYTKDFRYYANWIHGRHGFMWRHAAHEMVYCCAEEKIVTINSVLTEHHKDVNKPRNQYLDLLKLACKEEPIPRNYFYLGREYYYSGDLEYCVKTLEKYIEIGYDCWAAEKMAAILMLADCLIQSPGKYEKLLHYAMTEAPGEREPLYLLALYYYKSGQPHLGYAYALKCLDIKNNPGHVHTRPEAWNEMPNFVASICAFDMGMIDVAKKHGSLGLEINPNNEQLKHNATQYESLGSSGKSLQIHH